MTYDEIKEAKRTYERADREWEKAKREYWSDTPACSNTTCNWYSVYHINHCSFHNIQEDCRDYTAE